ncbi:glycosyltransferase family 2 protein [Aurantivibrio plasticivorans]
MPENQPEISVIVPVYNDWHLLPELLDCLSSQDIDHTKFEIIVVDNGSQEIDTSISQSANIRFFKCAQKGSYAARNVGIQNSQGKLLAFTDSDCRPSQKWLAKGYELYKLDKTSLIAGDIKVEPQNWSQLTSAEIHDVALGLPQKRYSTYGYAATANLFVPRSLFAEYGLFDGNRFSGGDAEFCRRVTSTGREIKFCQEALVVHPARRSYFELAKKRRRIKGAQFSAGTPKQQRLWIIRTIIPPLLAYKLIVTSRSITTAQKLRATLIETRLWFVGVVELIQIRALKKQAVR